MYALIVRCTSMYTLIVHTHCMLYVTPPGSEYPYSTVYYCFSFFWKNLLIVGRFGWKRLLKALNVNWRRSFIHFKHPFPSISTPRAVIGPLYITDPVYIYIYICTQYSPMFRQWGWGWADARLCPSHRAGGDARPWGRATTCHNMWGPAVIYMSTITPLTATPSHLLIRQKVTPIEARTIWTNYCRTAVYQINLMVHLMNAVCPELPHLIRSGSSSILKHSWLLMSFTCKKQTSLKSS